MLHGGDAGHDQAALLARGYTNRRIAKELTITDGTVGIHVEHILGKLGLYSRRQVADWVAEHGLPNPAYG